MPECNTMIPLQIQTSEQKPVRMMCKNQLPTSNPDHNLCLCLSVNPISSTKTGNGRSDQAFIPGWADPYLCVAWGCWTVDLECCCQIPLSRLFAADPSGRVQRWGKSQEVVLKVVCSEAALSCRLRQPIHSEARPGSMCPLQQRCPSSRHWCSFRIYALSRFRNAPLPTFSTNL